MNHILTFFLFFVAYIAITDDFQEADSRAESPQVADSTVFDNPVFGYKINLPNTITKYPLCTDYIFVGTSIQSIPTRFDFDLIIIMPDMTSLPENIKR